MPRIIFIFSFFFCFYAFCQNSDCEEDANTTVEINDCIIYKTKIAEETLETIVQEIQKGFLFSKDDKKAFLKAQQAWETYVEEDCDAVFIHNIEGSIRSIATNSRRLHHLEVRAKELWDEYLDHMATTVKRPK